MNSRYGTLLVAIGSSLLLSSFVYADEIDVGTQDYSMDKQIKCMHYCNDTYDLQRGENMNPPGKACLHGCKIFIQYGAIGTSLEKCSTAYTQQEILNACSLGVCTMSKTNDTYSNEECDKFQ